MALKLSGMVAALVRAVTPQKVEPEKVDPPKVESKHEFEKGENFAVQSVSLPLPPANPAKCVMHIWNPVSGKCIKCSALKPAQTGAVLSKGAAPVPKPVKGSPAAPKFDAPPLTTQDKPLPPEPYTILHAIREMRDGRDGVLMLIKTSTGLGYKVESVYDAADPFGMHIMLSGENGMTWKPKVGIRESLLYTPLWRD